MKKCGTCKVKKDENEFEGNKKTCNRCRNGHKKYYDSKRPKSCLRCNEICLGKRHKYCSNKCKILHNITEKENGCWEWNGKEAYHGYCSTKDYDKTYKNDMAHRISYRVFLGEITEGLCVLHRCDNRKCCNPEHLWLGTHSENTKDCVKKGRHLGCGPNGEKNGCAKLNEEKVKEIRKMAIEGKYHREIAKLFGVSQSVVTEIVNKKAWKHIEDIKCQR